MVPLLPSRGLLQPDPLRRWGDIKAARPWPQFSSATPLLHVEVLGHLIRVAHDLQLCARRIICAAPSGSRLPPVQRQRLQPSTSRRTCRSKNAQPNSRSVFCSGPMRAFSSCRSDMPCDVEEVEDVGIFDEHPGQVRVGRIQVRREIVGCSVDLAPGTGGDVVLQYFAGPAVGGSARAFQSRC